MSALLGVHRPFRTLAALVSWTLVAALVVVMGQAAPAFAAAITTTKSAPASVLAGAPIRFQIAASNPAGGTAAAEYNLTLRDVLPLGVTYVAGSTSPATAGEPDVRTTADGRQVLIWSNISDLPIGAREGLSFSATADATRYPVGSTVTNTADAYASTDPRRIARFDAQGAYTGGATELSSSAPTSTTISALEITKSEPSPENELLRGVHAHTTVYTLRTRNNGRNPTTGVSVVDLLPAQLEFLGCGGVDNSAQVEYPGAPSLTATPQVTADCPTPLSVTTVVNPAGAPAGVYTRVEWRINDLAAGEERVIRYRAGIPLRANAAFPGGPSGASLGQTANLDNNTGASTREGAGEQALTNIATASGTYQGPRAGGVAAEVTATDRLTVTAEDLSLQKSVTPGRFTGGGIATWTLTVRTGEYASASDIVLRDVLPDGLCPLSSTRNYAPGSPAPCAPVAGSDPTGADYDSVTANADGTYDIVFTPIAQGASAVSTVTFRARMLPSYGRGGMDPTVSGDGYRNTVSLTGTTTPVAATGVTGTARVNDDSAASLESDAPALDKRILPDTGTTPYVCGTDTAPYRDDLAASDQRVTFEEGDRACFLVRVDFSDANSTRNAVVTDFLPDGMTYEAGSATATAANTVAATVSEAGGVLTWQVGTPGGGGRFVAPGAVFEYTLAAIVGAPAAGPAPDLTGNLAKLRYENSGGAVFSLRDRVDLSLAAAPPVAVLKSARRVAGTAPVPAVVPENGNVTGGDTVEYTVRVTNNGAAATRNLTDVVGPDVWDVLPAGIACAQISLISDSGVCTDPGATGHPVARAGLENRSIIRWNLPDSVVIAPGASLSLTYRVLFRPETSVSTAFVNNAAVSTYASPTNRGGLADHAPATNIDRAVVDTDTPAAEDTHRVVTRDAVVDKTLSTEIAETGNDRGTQATVGERVSYTYSVVVPRGTTVYAGRLADTLPAGVTLISGTPAWRFFPDNASTTEGAQPAGFTLGASGALTFPTAWTNDTATDQRFEVTVDVLAANTGNHAATRVNTATFDSTAGVGGPAIAQRRDSATFTLVLPSPTLTKTEDDADDIVVVGQEITYTLTARNAANRPPLHDAFVVDCLPDGLVLVGGSASPTPRDVSPGTGSNGCVAGATRIEWSVGDIAGGGSAVLTYRARVSDAAGGAQRYTNSAELSGSTMDDDKPTRATADRATERAFTVPASTTVGVQPAAVDKTVERPSYTIGERARWTVRTTLPAQVNFYDAAVIDQLPLGISVASLELESATCQVAGGGTCALPGGATPLATAPGSGGATQVGWSLGDLLSSPEARTVTLVYSGVVADIADNARGDVLSNTATLKWDLVDGQPPTSAGEAFGAQATPDTAPFTVTEPVLSVTKRADDTTPAPGQDYAYTVTVSNAAAGANASAAHDVVVTDRIPAGVVVDPATISAGGTLTGADPARGGGTIAWLVEGPIAPGASVALTYGASLASPADPDALVNTADIGSHHSLPDESGREYDGPSTTETVRAALPRVTIDKTATGSGVAYIGEPQQWRLEITSSGGSTAFGVDARDVLPPNWTYDAATARVSVAGGPAVGVEPVVTGDPQVLTWTDLGDLPVGQRLVITFDATPGADVVDAPGVGSGTAHVNTAGTTAEDAEGEQADADGTSYAGPDDTAAVRIHSADLAIDKAHSGQAVAGQSLAWTLTVTNRGADAAVGPWTVTDSLPAALVDAAVTATGSGWTCDRVDGEVTCTRPAGTALASGASLPVITVTAALPVDLAEGSTLSNLAEVDGRTFDPQPGNDADTDDVTVITRADLTIDKEVSGEVVAGRDATWTVVVTNDGPSVARAPFSVTDTLPAGATLRSVSGDGWTCAAPVGRDVVCTYAEDLAVGESATSLTVVAGIPSGQTAAVVNRAEITATTTTDPTPGDADQVSTDPDAEADLALSKTRIGDVVAGENATYELAVFNAGDSDAAGISITDDLPDGLTYVGSTSVDGAWTCGVAGGVVTCDLTGTLPAGETARVRIEVAVASSVVGSIVNEATVDAVTRDPNPGNDTDEDDSSIDVEADLSIAKSHTGRVLAGGQVAYTLQVTNEGPSDSPGPITVTDALPDGMSLVSASGDGWVCAPAEGVDVSCVRELGVADGADAPAITVVADVASDAGPATLVNRASVDGPADPNVENDTASDPTVVEDEADVAIEKVATDPTPVAGGTVVFDLIVSNAGPSDADDVIVVDDMPAGLTAIEASGTGWTCEVTTTSVSCERPTLAAGAVAPSIAVTARIDSALPDDTSIVNDARVSTATGGDLPGDNADDAEIVLDTETDLRIVKSHTDRAVPGRSMRFDLLVRNGGPSDVTGPVTVVDTLPEGMSFVGARGTDWICEADGAEVTCTHPGPVAAGQALPGLEITVQIDPSATGELANVAAVEPRADDTDPDNDVDRDAVTAEPEVDLSVDKSHASGARIGDELTFEVAVRNDGPSTATGVRVTDRLPEGLEFVSGSGEGWTCVEDGDVLCALADPVGPGASAATLLLTVRVTAAAYPGVTNVVTVSSDGTETDEEDNVDRDPVTVPPLSNLTIDKSHEGDLVVGSTADYRIRVTNEGPTEDPGPITVTDTLPLGLTLVGSAGDGWTCTGEEAVECTYAEGLAVDESVELVLTVSVAPEAYPSVLNVAAVDSPTEETDTEDNADEDPAVVIPTSALSIDKSLRSISRDGRVVYDIEVTNGGPSVTVDPIRVVDALPTQLRLVEADGTGWECARQRSVATCSYPEAVAVGETVGFTVVADVRRGVAAGERIVNTAVLDLPGDDDLSDSAVTRVPSQGGAGDGDGDGAGPGGGSGETPGSGADGGSTLPDAGGPAWWWWAVAMISLLAGAGLIRSGRRDATE